MGKTVDIPWGCNKFMRQIKGQADKLFFVRTKSKTLNSTAWSLQCPSLFGQILWIIKYLNVITFSKIRKQLEDIKISDRFTANTEQLSEINLKRISIHGVLNVVLSSYHWAPQRWYKESTWIPPDGSDLNIPLHTFCISCSAAENCPCCFTTGNK